jgi:hypothetical protein
MPTIEEQLAAIAARAKSSVLLPDEITQLELLLAQRVAELVRSCDTVKAALQAEINVLKARIAELEGGVTPPPPPPPPPTGTAPKILDERFDKPLNMDVFYIDKDGEAGTVSVANGQCLFRWKATSDLTDMRAQMVMRAIVGGGGTPRRDPIGSERFYAFGIYLPPTYVFDSQWGNRKCVTGQIHQGNEGGIVSPPFSFEQIKTSADGEVMRGVLAVKGRETKTINIGRPPRSESKILIHVKWSPGSDGFLKVYRDGVLTPFNHSGPTCNPRILNGETVQDLNPSIGCYNPGRKSGDFTVGYVREVMFTYWQIGTVPGNTIADMLGAP